MGLPSSEVIADLKQKHGDVFFADFGEERLLFRKPAMPEVDAYLLGTVRGTAEESANNLIFAARLWPSVEQLQESFDEAPAVVAKCAESVMETAGADEETMAGLVPATLDKLSDEQRAELEQRTGQKVSDLENSHPRGVLRYVRLPGVGISVFRRPTRSSYAAFADASKKDEVMQACRDLSAECAITDAKALPGVFASAPAVPFYLAFALASLAGAHLEVRSGKL